MSAATAATATRSAPKPPTTPPITPAFLDTVYRFLMTGAAFMTTQYAGNMQVTFWFSEREGLYYSRYQFTGHPFVTVKTPFILDLLEEIHDRAPELFALMHAGLAAKASLELAPVAC